MADLSNKSSSGVVSRVEQKQPDTPVVPANPAGKAAGLDFAQQFGRLSQVPYGDQSAAGLLLQSGAVTMGQFLAWQEATKHELSKTAGRSAGTITVKTSAKGAVSVYGLNSRMPTTLYASQWLRLAGCMPQILKHILAECNNDKTAMGDKLAASVENTTENVNAAYATLKNDTQAILAKLAPLS